MRTWQASVLFLCLAYFACDSTNAPPPPQPQPIPTITLTAQDVGLTEVQLRLGIPDTVQSRQFILVRDSELVISGVLGASDTVVVDDGLLPNGVYTYRGYRLLDTTIVDSTVILPVTTMDTTSHAFLWTIDTLGDATSQLRDATIVNDNDIWAVGLMFRKDSSGQTDPVQYNAAHWDGSAWSIIRLMFPICDINGNEVGMAPFECHSVFAFEENDIWFASSGSITCWDGVSFMRLCIPTAVLPGSINRIWGINSNSVFVVGNLGTIAHYDGGNWGSMESGTTVDLLDVWGSADGSTVWACGYDPTLGESVLLRYNGSIWEEYGHSPPQGGYQDLFASVWFPRKDSAFVVGNRGIFRHAQGISTGFRMLPVELSDLPYRIRGIDRNDATLVGNNGMVWHFNGLMWHNFTELVQPLDLLISVAVSPTYAVAVGQRYYSGIEYYGVVYRGRR